MFQQFFLLFILADFIYSYEISSYDTHEIATYTEILSNDFVNTSNVTDHLECLNSCINDNTCKSAKTDGYV